jgi:outer membrane protein OmpA-like peptidoglycan-associated protein
MRLEFVPIVGLAILTLGAAPRPMTICTPGPYIAFFAWGSAEIDGNAAPILANMIENLTGEGCQSVVRRIEIGAYTDTSEAPRLSIARARAIQRYFRGYGIKLNLFPTGYGPTPLRVSTGTGVRERQNRRVEIYFKPA